jgi:hypothetical protein
MLTGLQKRRFAQLLVQNVFIHKRLKALNCLNFPPQSWALIAEVNFNTLANAVILNTQRNYSYPLSFHPKHAGDCQHMVDAWPATRHTASIPNGCCI